MNTSADALLHVLTREIDTEPGTAFNYNGELTQLLAAILETSTGRELEDDADEVLFRPLGIERFQWKPDLQGMPRAASGLRLTGRDLVRLGLAFSGGGAWDGRQVVPPSWVQEATHPHIDQPVLPEDRDRVLRAGYGYQWWFEEYVTPLGPMPTTYAQGNGGQMIFIVPGHDLVVVTLAGHYNQPSWTPHDILLRVLTALREPRR